MAYNDDSGERELSRNQAAARLKVSPRTVSRMAERGDLRRLPNGNFSHGDVLEQAENGSLDLDENPEAVLVKSLIDALQGANDHSERMLQLIEKPTQQVLSTLETINTSLLAQLKDSQDINIQMMTAMGDVMLKREERSAVIRESEAKSKVLLDAGQMVVSNIPKLVGQLSGANKVADFVRALSDEETSLLNMMVMGFEDSPAKQRALIEILNTSGVDFTPKKQLSPESGANEADK